MDTVDLWQCPHDSDIPQDHRSARKHGNERPIRALHPTMMCPEIYHPTPAHIMAHIMVLQRYPRRLAPFKSETLALGQKRGQLQAHRSLEPPSCAFCFRRETRNRVSLQRPHRPSVKSLHDPHDSRFAVERLLCAHGLFPCGHPSGAGLPEAGWGYTYIYVPLHVVRIKCKTRAEPRSRDTRRYGGDLELLK